MRRALFPCLLFFAATAAHAQSASDFQLPPDPDATPTARPQAQGPIDLEGENRSAPRVILPPTATPTPAVTPRPSASPRASETTRPQPSATRSARPNLPTSDAPVSTREVLAEPAPRASAPSRASTDSQDSGAGSAPGDTGVVDTGAQETAPEPDAALPANVLPETVPDDTAQPVDAFDASSDNEGTPGWLWGALMAGLALLLGAVILFAARRRSRARAEVQAAPADLSGPPLREIHKHSALSRLEAASLGIEAHATTLSRSVVNATVAYRLTIVNRGRAPISQVRIAGDLTTAHGRVPTSQQVADPDHSYPELHTIDHLDPGERAVIRGELRLPLSEVRALQQGQVPVFVPLMRLTVRTAEQKPSAHTFVIGNKPAGSAARPAPFRLDEGPRTYSQLTTRALA
ncbi:hypothetical protein KYN89_09945 [Alteriqipengyuania sp. NZ-12B]|uniref:DUF3426 domain-containing protein n=1 Tax=Alteriqipengyuania abyssalis TaxID=2860200 RepID=A0ABS7PFU9_9SPHN|nr:hypothetical protein [Alteriqipengyuania abyssalis]MBY8337373.1 hypothetical protein [Alteriqipengyuania abyssalis]